MNARAQTATLGSLIGILLSSSLSLPLADDAPWRRGVLQNTQYCWLSSGNAAYYQIQHRTIQRVEGPSPRHGCGGNSP